MGEKRSTIILEPVSKRIEVKNGTSVYHAILAAGLPVIAFCGGQGTCGKCKFRVIENEINLSKPSDSELKSLGEEYSKGYRLACQAKILGNVRIFLTEDLLPKNSKILIDDDIQSLGIKLEKSVNSIIETRVLNVPKPTLEKPTDDFTRMIDSLKKVQMEEHSINSKFNNIDDLRYFISKKLPYSLREDSGIVTLYFRTKLNENSVYTNKNLELFDIEPGNKIKEVYGLALDIGTTTIVGYLISLVTGDLVSISAMLNPQVAIGEDLISRMTYIKQTELGLKKAQLFLTKAVNDILKQTCQKGKIEIKNVKDIVIVGNTGIHHMFFGLPSEFLAKAPFPPVFKTAINVTAKNLDLVCEPNVNVYSPPVVAGYVGTDTIGCVVSSQIDLYEELSLLIDIGTNGEIVLGNIEGLSTGSVAAGSALEGAQIKFGMRAAAGAIETVKIDPHTLKPDLGIIGNAVPIGICGSGLIDVVAEMLRCKILTRSGKFNKKNPEIMSHKRIKKIGNTYHYIVFDKEMDSDIFENCIQNQKRRKEDIEQITISQDDVRQIQLAKGAFLAGSYILLKNAIQKNQSLKQVILAGAFGNYIDKKNAAFIGLFPDIDINRIYQIGNAAGLGSQLCLVDSKYRDLANKVAHSMKYYEIASDKEFQNIYAYSLYFPYYDLEKFPNLKDLYKDIPVK